MKRPKLRIVRSVCIAYIFWCVAQASAAREPVDYVRPIDWAKFKGVFEVQAGDAFGESLVGVLQNEARYELAWVGTQYDVVKDAEKFKGVPYYNAYTHFSRKNYGAAIRPLSSFGYGMAAMLATGVYSERAGGRPREAALRQAEMAIRGVSFAHRANKTTAPAFGGRGDSTDTWQGGYWASHVAEAAWLVWDELSPETRQAVANMVVYEADSYIDYVVPYWKNADGTSSDPGDTKAEENAWNARMPALAQMMMPDQPHVAAWRRKASELQVSAYSCESDLKSSRLVDGKPLKDWLKGFNAFPDGILVNHNIVHPDYMSSYAQLWLVVPESLAGQTIPQSTVFNFDKVYQALTEVEFVAGESPYGTGKMLPPGGTIYRRGADGEYDGRVYFPQGNDWSYEVADGFINSDLVAEWLVLDRGKPYDSMGWARARLKAIVALQNRPGHDGNISEAKDSIKHSPRGVDEDFFRSNSVAWLQWCLMQHGRMSPIGDHWGPAAVAEDKAGNTAAPGGVGDQCN